MARRRGIDGDGRDGPWRDDRRPDRDWRDASGSERFPAPSRPIAVQGGIRAQTKRGRFAESWWAARWIAVLERFDIGARLVRGRSYARRGQVLSIEVGKGLVRARVQGSRTTPYDVSVKVRPLTPAEWTRVARQLASEAGYAARLLAGEMPHDIEQAFGRAGSSLFPEQSRELATACSCPDWSNPCKHVAAVYYLLGEEFDRDPFLLFTLRGRTRDELLAELAHAGAAPRATSRGRRRDARSKDEPEVGDGSPGASATKAGRPSRGRPSRGDPSRGRPRNEGHASPAPLARGNALSPDRFWRGSAAASPSPSLDHVSIADAPSAHAELVRRLGRFPFWRGERPPLDVLEPHYADASRRALEVLSESAAAPHVDADADAS